MMRPAPSQDNKSIATITEKNEKVTSKPSKKRQRTKKVHFADEHEKKSTESKQNKATRTHKELPAGLTLATCEELWYQNKEIDVFKSETRELIIFGKRKDDDELGGLERFTLERSTLKKNAIKYVLFAQMQKQGSGFIREVSRRFSACAVDTALIQGFKDFCEVYDPLASLFGGNIMCSTPSRSGSENYNESFFGDEENDSKRKSFANSNHPVARLKRRKYSRSGSFSQTFDLAQIYHATNSTNSVGHIRIQAN